jgi:hypothetical protein
MLTVADLRRSGFKVKVFHKRRFVKNQLSPTGGYTGVALFTPEGDTYLELAKCNKNDNYDRRIGVSIALGRCLKSYDMVYNKNKSLQKVKDKTSLYCVNESLQKVKDKTSLDCVKSNIRKNKFEKLFPNYKA